MNDWWPAVCLSVCLSVRPREADRPTHALHPLGCCKLLCLLNTRRPRNAHIHNGSGHDHCKLLANVPPLGTPSVHPWWGTHRRIDRLAVPDLHVSDGRHLMHICMHLCSQILTIQGRPLALWRRCAGSNVSQGSRDRSGGRRHLTIDHTSRRYDICRTFSKTMCGENAAYRLLSSAIPD